MRETSELKDTILNVASELFAENGYAATLIKQLVKWMQKLVLGLFIGRIDALEDRVAAMPEVHRSVADSPVRFEIMKEKMKRENTSYDKIRDMFDFSADLRNEEDTPGRNDKGLVTFDWKTKKDTYFFYQAQWTEEPMVYITSRRFVDRREATTYIKVFSNCDLANLRVNGKELGEMELKEMCIHMAENVSLSPGENIIEVVGRKADQTVKDSYKWILTPTSSRR